MFMDTGSAPHLGLNTIFLISVSEMITIYPIAKKLFRIHLVTYYDLIEKTKLFWKFSSDGTKDREFWKHLMNSLNYNSHRRAKLIKLSLLRTKFEIYRHITLQSSSLTKILTSKFKNSKRIYLKRQDVDICVESPTPIPKYLTTVMTPYHLYQRDHPVFQDLFLSINNRNRVSFVSDTLMHLNLVNWKNIRWVVDIAT